MIWGLPPGAVHTAAPPLCPRERAHAIGRLGRRSHATLPAPQQDWASAALQDSLLILFTAFLSLALLLDAFAQCVPHSMLRRWAGVVPQTTPPQPPPLSSPCRWLCRLLALKHCLPPLPPAGRMHTS